MTRIRIMLFASAATVTIAACAPKAGPVDTSADVAALNAVQVRELAAVGSANADSLGVLYTADAMLLPPGEAAVNGPDAVRKWFEGMVKDNTFTGKYSESKFEVSGDLGVAVYSGELTMTPKAKGGKPATESVRGVHIFKRQADGTWKIAQDIWNSGAPPTPAAK